MFAYILYLCFMILAISTIGCLYRLAKGPSVPDRVIALDTIGINIICFVALLSIQLSTSTFLEIILLIGILAFIGTIAFSKFIERGVVFERKRD